MRIDKFLWCVRLFKTRTLATEACQKERVKLNGNFVKSSKIAQVGDKIEKYEQGIWRIYAVKQFPKSRIGAKLVAEYITELTNQHDLDKLLQIQETNRQNHLLGIKGRPTKKDRRDWQKFNG